VHVPSAGPVDEVAGAVLATLEPWLSARGER